MFIVWVLLVLTATVGWHEFRTTGGPLAEDGDGYTSLTIPADVGQEWTVGVFAPANTGGDVVLDSIVPDTLPEGLILLGTGRLPWGQGGIGSDRGFPPSGHEVLPVAGTIVPPGEGVAFVIGLEPSVPGRYVIPGFSLYYHAGWHHYVAHYVQRVVVCPPGPDGSPRCHGSS